MPRLPSGLKVALSGDAVIVHDGNWFTCPEGHFWFERPDLKISPTPYGQDSLIIQDFVHAPVPKNREEALQYIRVLHADAQGIYFWRGEWLTDYLSPTDLDRSDTRAWRRWLRTRAVEKFIDYVISICADQAIQNRNNTGIAFFHNLSVPVSAINKKYPLMETRTIEDWLMDGDQRRKKSKVKLSRNATAFIMISHRRTKRVNGDYDRDEEDPFFDPIKAIQEKGTLILSREWDSGSPGGGAGQESVYWYKGKYWLCSDDFDNAGPYDDLNALLSEYKLLAVSEATTEIYCPHLSAKKLAGYLKWRDAVIKDFEIVINGETWRGTNMGTFERCKEMRSY